MPTNNCKICETKSVDNRIVPYKSDIFEVTCPLCGIYHIVESLSASTLDISHGDRILMSGYLRNNSTRENPIVLTTYKYDEIKKSIVTYRNLTIDSKENSIFEDIHNRMESSIDVTVGFNIFNDFTKYYCKNLDELRSILNDLGNKNLIEIISHNPRLFTVKLTIDGLRKCDLIKRITTLPQESTNQKSTDNVKNKKRKFYDKWWFKLILASFILPLAVGLILMYFQNKSLSGQKNNLQSSSVSGINNSNVSGDIVGRDKIINQTVISVSTGQGDKDKQNKIKISKVKINWIIEDLSLAVNSVKNEYFKGSERIANDFNSRNILKSGVYIKAQMDFANSTKEEIEKLLAKGHRDIEGVLLENLKITNLGEMAEFSEEEKRLSELEKNIIPGIYKQLENTVKSLEISSLGTTQITKDFKL